MTKSDKVALINAAIAKDRNSYARSIYALAYMANGRIYYRDEKPGYVRRISLREMLCHLHGEDIRAIRAVL